MFNLLAQNSNDNLCILLYYMPAVRNVGFITCPAVIFSRLSTPNFWLITSTIPISLINSLLEHKETVKSIAKWVGKLAP